MFSGGVSGHLLLNVVSGDWNVMRTECTERDIGWNECLDVFIGGLPVRALKENKRHCKGLVMKQKCVCDSRSLVCVPMVV